MLRYGIALMTGLLLAATALRGQDAPQVWIQIEARPSLTEAQEGARAYAATLPDVNGFSLGRGWYAIALGPYRREEARRVLEVYRAEGVIPRDSYIAESSAYKQQFWPIGASFPGQPATAQPDAPPVIAQDPAPVPAPAPAAVPLDETPREARASESLLSAEARAALQTALKWAGVYDGAIDAAFGPGTRAAMALWQEQNGHEPTGILTTRQRTALLERYNAVLDGLGLEVLRDAATGIAMKLPLSVVAFDRYEPPFAHFNATGDIDARVLLISQQGNAATLAGLYDVMQSLTIVPQDGPRALESDRFTLIGEDAGHVSQSEVWLRDGAIKGFTLVWPAGDEERRKRLMSEMLGSFEWLPGTLDPAEGAGGEQRIDLISGLELRQPKLSRSGFFVDGDGAVLTTSEVVQDCRRITIDETYDAEVAVTDAALGVAVLRPSRPLAPRSVAIFQERVPRLLSDVAVAGYSYGGALGAPTLTFGQVSDLRGLSGETHLERLTLDALEGDAGGPVLDAGGAVLGMLLPRQQDGRVLPQGVSFAATNGALQAVLAQGGIAPRTTAELDRIPAERLTDRAGALTVLVSCWE